MKKIHMNWKMYGNGVQIICKKLRSIDFKFDGVHGIPRGGSILAVTLSRLLSLPLLSVPTKNTIIVDDISDTGKTLEPYKGNFIVTLYSTDWTSMVPDIYCYTKNSKEDWIIFPWEEYDE